MKFAAKTISSLTAVLLVGVSSIALAQTPAQTPAPVAPAAPAAAPTAPAAAAPAAKPAAPAAATPAPAAPGAAAPAAAAAPKVDPSMAKFQASCKADVEKYCAEANAERKAGVAAAKTGDAAAPKGKGRGQVVACLNTNLANLTPDCKTAFEERKAAAKAKKS
jgi:Cysteine rich repeat